MGEGTILSHARDGYWNSLESFCEESFRKTSDPIFMFWKAFAEYNLGNGSGAINSLLVVQQKKEVAYACIVALLYYQGKAQHTDRVSAFPRRNKFTASGPENAKNAEVQQTEPSPTLYSSSLLWENLEKLPI